MQIQHTYEELVVVCFEHQCFKEVHLNKRLTGLATLNPASMVCLAG